MTTQPLPLDNGLPTASKRLPTVHVQELPLCSPTGESSEDFSHGVIEVVGATPDDFVDSSNITLDGLSLKRPSRGGHSRKSNSRPDIRRRSSSMGSPGVVKVKDANCSSQRELSLGSHRSKTRDNAGSFVVRMGKDRATVSRRSDTVRDRASSLEDTAAPTNRLGPLPPRGWFTPTQLIGQAQNGPVAPLTPPEDLDAFKWESSSQTQSIDGIRTVSTIEPSHSQSQTNNLSRTSSASRPSEIQMPGPSDLTGGDSSTPNWLGRACQRLGKVLDTNSGLALLLIMYL